MVVYEPMLYFCRSSERSVVAALPQTVIIDSMIRVFSDSRPEGRNLVRCAHRGQMLYWETSMGNGELRPSLTVTMIRHVTLQRIGTCQRCCGLSIELQQTVVTIERGVRRTGLLTKTYSCNLGRVVTSHAFMDYPFTSGK